MHTDIIDKYIFKNYINQICNNGIYLELGAFNGTRYSNTKFFEDNLNFSGILIEPSLKQFQKLIIRRPKSTCYIY